MRAFENRCAHRGALICVDDKGKGKKDFSCVYHAWTYDLEGTLTGVAFQKGVKGKGGMAPGFKLSDHGPRKLRVATLARPRVRHVRARRTRARRLSRR